MASSNVESGGIGLLPLLTIIFVVLKLTDNIDWSWWWVLSPIPIVLGVALGVFAVVLSVLMIGKKN